MPPDGFEPEIPASERPQTDTLDRAATGIGIYIYIYSVGRQPNSGSGCRIYDVYNTQLGTHSQ